MLNRKTSPVAVLALAALALVGCSAPEPEVPAAEKPAAVEATPAPAPAEDAPTDAAPVSAPAVDRQAEWSTAIASFPQALPSGVTWPASVPEDWPAGGTSLNGSDVATYFWACSVLSAAQAQAEAGNADAAARLVDHANEVPPPYGLQQGRAAWDVIPDVPAAGDSGLCAQWLGGWVNN